MAPANGVKMIVAGARVRQQQQALLATGDHWKLIYHANFKLVIKITSISLQVALSSIIYIIYYILSYAVGFTNVVFLCTKYKDNDAFCI